MTVLFNKILSKSTTVIHHSFAKYKGSEGSCLLSTVLTAVYTLTNPQLPYISTPTLYLPSAEIHTQGAIY
jgi:hypothetical protein